MAVRDRLGQHSDPNGNLVGIAERCPQGLQSLVTGALGPPTGA